MSKTSGIVDDLRVEQMFDKILPKEPHKTETYYELAERLSKHPQSATNTDIRILSKFTIELWGKIDDPQLSRSFCVPI